MKHLLILCITWLASILPASASNTWYVDVNGTAPGTGTPANPYTSIQFAITQPATQMGDTILVAPGIYVENIDVPAYLNLIAVGGPEVTVIQPSQAGNTVHIQAGNLVGFTIRPPIAPGPCCTTAAVSIFYGFITRCVISGGGTSVYTGVRIESDCDIARTTITGFQIGIELRYYGLVQLETTILGGNQVDLHLPIGFQLMIRYSAGLSNISPPYINPTQFGVGNLVGDVGFWDALHGDLHLRPGSMCINAGNPGYAVDPDGSRSDIGALTYDGTYAPGPRTYCTGKLNSAGCVPAIGAIGTASATSGAPFTITAVNEVGNKVGLMLMGFERSRQTFQGGLLCVQSPLSRLGVQSSGGVGACTGAFAFDMGGYIVSGAHPGLLPGALVACQWWNRDPLDPAGFGCGLSDALAFGIAP